jgi:hypothetical protein
MFEGWICLECEKAEQEPSGETVSLEAFKQVMGERNIAIEQLHELGYEFGQKIDKQAVPIEILQEIRQEIADAKLPNDDEICKANNYGLNTALVIIDKHIAESEDKE